MLMHATMAALAVFICFAGNYLTGQSMMERPLVVGLVTGILMGDMKTGILMGASLEAVFLGNVNIGGVIAAEPVTATTLATTFAIISNVEQKAAMTLAAFWYMGDLLFNHCIYFFHWNFSWEWSGKFLC